MIRVWKATMAKKIVGSVQAPVCTAGRWEGVKNPCEGAYYHVVAGDEMRQFMMCKHHLEQLLERAQRALV